MKTFFYVGINKDGKILKTEAKNKTFLNKKIDWERFNSFEDAQKRIKQLKNQGWEEK